MKTRKEIGDKYGVRSLYVIECQSFGGQWECYYWRGGFNSFKEACANKEIIYRNCKAINKRWTRRDFRVALYVRAE